VRPTVRAVGRSERARRPALSAEPELPLSVGRADFAGMGGREGRCAERRQWTRLTTTPELDPQQPFALIKGATLPVNAGGNSESEQRRREDGSEPQVEASLKRQEADPVRRKCRMATAQQSRLRSRRWPRPAVPGLLGKRCCAPDRFRARRCALRLQVRQGVPVPRRQATPSVRIEDNLCESWP
jgi:hypothetical protein